MGDWLPDVNFAVSKDILREKEGYGVKGLSKFYIFF